MATIRTEVDVDLDDFDTADLVQEIKYRSAKGLISTWEKQAVVRALNSLLGLNGDELSVIDEMKLETFKNNMDKKTIEEIENFFKT